MNFFSTYYNTVPIFFIHNKEEVLRVNTLLNTKVLDPFFENENVRTLVCSTKVNEIQKINERFRTINGELALHENYIGHFETYSSRLNNSIYTKTSIIKQIYLLYNFFFHRVFPRTRFIKNIYFFITKGNKRLLSKAEVLGRLVYNGFEILQLESKNGLIYFKVKKVSEPEKRKNNYGLIFKLPRIGKNGKLFDVYKIRTMHPYSEFLQDYMLKEHGLNAKGKLDRDFRITPWGNWFRKYWIDEIPQLWNVIKGDMKIVGVRPVSESYFRILPEDLQIKRVENKPGCIPPYVAMNKKPNLRSVLSSEKVYLKLKEENPYSTDLKFFFFALVNILFKGKRSS